ncbi:MAG: yrrB [Verrucomicrobia bacterium]|nr:yrrB [Verrucomicrobiota bacterium]
MKSPPSSHRAWPIFLAAALIVGAVILSYANTLAVPFAFDDKAAILENPTLRQLWPLSVPLSPPRNGSGVTGRPLVNLSLALNYANGGVAVRGYHVTNIAIHALAALALLGLARRTLLSPRLHGRFGHSALPLATIIALVWSTHPLLTESVTSVIQRNEAMVALCYFLTLYGFARGASAATASSRRTWQITAWTACALGMLTKEVMVTAPVIVFLYDRTFFAGSFREAWKLRARAHLAFAATWAILATLVIGMGGSRGAAAGVGLGVSVGDYALTQFHAVALYLKLAFWPHPLVFDYGWGVIRDASTIWPQVALICALVGATVVSLRRWPVIGFFGAWFFVILSPSSSVVPLVTQTIAEHRMYLPLAGVVALVFGALFRFLGRASFALGGLLVPVLVVATVVRNRDYRSEVDLWADTVAKVPANARAQNNQAEVLIAAGRGTEALAPATEAVRLKPDYPEALNNLGIALAQLGRTAESIAPYEAALKVRPSYAGAHANLGAALAQLGRFDEAELHLKEGLRLTPQGAEMTTLRNNLGNVFLQTKRMEEAIAQYDIALGLNPGFVDAHYNRGAALSQVGRNREAAEEFRTVLRLNPQHPAAQAALDYVERRSP